MNHWYYVQTIVLPAPGPPVIGFVAIVPTAATLEISVTAFYPITAAPQAWEDLRRILGNRGFELSPARTTQPYRYAAAHQPEEPPHIPPA